MSDSQRSTSGDHTIIIGSQTGRNPYYFAWCQTRGCGWIGPMRETEEQARSNGELHKRTAAKVERIARGQ